MHKRDGRSQAKLCLRFLLFGNNGPFSNRNTSSNHLKSSPQHFILVSGRPHKHKYPIHAPHSNINVNTREEYLIPPLSTGEVCTACVKKKTELSTLLQ